MAVSLLEIEPIKVSKDLSSYSMLVYGEPKIGKTTFVHDLYGKRVLHLMTEKRYKTLAGAYVRYISNWTEFTKTLAELRQPKVKEMFDVVSIDTVDNLFKFYKAYVAAKWKENSIGERTDIWGKDWRELDDGWQDALSKIERAGYVPVFVSHAQQTVTQIPKSGLLESDAADLTSYNEVQSKKDGMTYLEFEKTVPGLKEKQMAPINKMVDNILFLSQTADERGTEHRVIHTRGTLQWMAGSTFDGIKPVIELSADAYRKAISDSIDLLDEEQLTDVRQADTDVVTEALNYDEIMAAVKKVGAALSKAGHKDRVVAIGDEVFGLDNKITDATPAQVELLAIANEKLKELATQLGVSYA